MGPQPSVSASYIKGLLAARCKTTAKSARTTTTKRRRRRTTTASTTKADGTVVKRRYKRRKRRRRAPVRARTAAVKVAKPKKKTAEIAIQTSDYLAGDGEDDFPPMNVSVGTSNSSSTPRLKTKKKEQKGDIIDSKKKVKNETKLEILDKKPTVLDVITLSDDDTVMPVKRKKKNSQPIEDDGPSTSRGTGGGRKPASSRRRVLDSSTDDDSDYDDVEERIASKKLAKKPPQSKKTPVGAAVPPVSSTAELPAQNPTPELLEADTTLRAQMIHNFLFTPPIAAAIAKNLPMRSLNALSQVNPLLRDICRMERIKKRRQTFDFFLRQSISTALDPGKMWNEQHIFDSGFTDLYCEPDLVLAFCSPRILYDYKINFDSPRSRHNGQYKVLHDIIGDLMPANMTTTGSTKIVHVRTHGVMPPLPIKGIANARKRDEFGCRESARDLCVLVIPKIQGVNMWREYLTASDLRKQLRDSGWLEHRSENHFLLPVIKDLEPLSPRLVMIFSRRRANYDHVASPEFPVIVLNTLDEFVGCHALPDADYGLEWLAFGGNATIYQVCIKGASGRLERTHQIRQLRDQFTAQQVMGNRMLLFYFRNVTKFETENTTEQTELLERDIIQLREEFPGVPIFGGGYQNAIGSCFVKDKTIPDFGKFISGLHSAFVCGVVLGGN